MTPPVEPSKNDGFWARVSPEPNTGCWLWVGRMAWNGYGLFYDCTQKRSFRAHRKAYEIMVGQVPFGLQLDHLCRVRACVNPEHLEPVTLRENLARGLGTVPASIALVEMLKSKTHCPNGHLYFPENLLSMEFGIRRCKACRIAKSRRSSEKRRRRRANDRPKA